MNTTVLPLLDIVEVSKSLNHKQIVKRKKIDEHQKRKRKWDYNI